MIFPIEAGEKTCQTAFSESIFAATKTLNTQQHEGNDSQILEKIVQQRSRRTSNASQMGKMLQALGVQRTHTRQGNAYLVVPV